MSDPYAAVVDPQDSRARVDAAVRTGAGLTLWLGLLLVSYWWATGGGFQDLAGWETGLTSAGRLTGLVASDLLLVQVLLMARSPFSRRRTGRTGWPGCTGLSGSPRST